MKINRCQNGIKMSVITIILGLLLPTAFAELNPSVTPNFSGLQSNYIVSDSIIGEVLTIVNNLCISSGVNSSGVPVSPSCAAPGKVLGFDAATNRIAWVDAGTGTSGETYWQQSGNNIYYNDGQVQSSSDFCITGNSAKCLSQVGTGTGTTGTNYWVSSGNQLYPVDSITGVNFVNRNIYIGGNGKGIIANNHSAGTGQVLSRTADGGNDWVNLSTMIPSAGSQLWTAGSGSIYYTAGNVGVGTASPQARLDVNGHEQVSSVRITGATAPASSYSAVISSSNFTSFRTVITDPANATMTMPGLVVTAMVTSGVSTSSTANMQLATLAAQTLLLHPTATYSEVAAVLNSDLLSTIPLSVQGNAVVNGTLSVANNVNVQGTVTANDFISTGTDFKVITGGGGFFEVGSAGITASDITASGDVTVGDKLTVNGLTESKGNSVVRGDLNVSGFLTVGSTSDTTDNYIKFDVANKKLAEMPSSHCNASVYGRMIIGSYYESVTVGSSGGNTTKYTYQTALYVCSKVGQLLSSPGDFTYRWVAL